MSIENDREQKKYRLVEGAITFVVQSFFDVFVFLILPFWKIAMWIIFMKWRRRKLKYQMSTHRQEVIEGERFEFGKNWLRFIGDLTEHQIVAAEHAISTSLGDVFGKTFLDVGCGSGLSSLAAYRLGALVRSFDCDPNSVQCTKTLQRKVDLLWPVEQGSALDQTYLNTLGKFDIVYSWGVLHHTRAMWSALDATSQLVKPGGLFLVALYNDQGWKSRVWKAIKTTYNKYLAARIILVAMYAIPMTTLRWSVRAATGRLDHERGMSLWRDSIDWLGGYPFEVTKPQPVIDYMTSRSFLLERLTDVGTRSGCNEFIFRLRAVSVSTNL